MGRISKGARLAVAAALVASALCAVAVARLGTLPTLTTVLARAPSQTMARRLVVSSPDGLVVVESNGAFRVTPEMQLQPIAWPNELRVDEVLSVAQRDGALAIVYRYIHERGLLLIEGDHARDVRGLAIAKGAELLAVHAGERGFDLYFSGHGATLLHGVLAPPFTAVDAVVPLPALGISSQTDELEGMVFVGAPLVVVRERSHYWLVGLDGQIHKMPPHSMTVWSASYTNVPIAFGSQVPFLDENGVPHFLAEGAPYPALAASADGTLTALALDRAADPPDAIESATQGGKIALRVAPGELLSRTPARPFWKTVASLPAPAGFAAFPAGTGWIALSGDGTQAVRLDRAGDRLLPTRRAATIARVTGHSLAFFAGGLLVVLLLAAALPILLVRTLRALRILDEEPAHADAPNARGLFVGTLEAPPGSVLATDRAGRVHLGSACRLRAGGVVIELDPGPRRADPIGGVPLVAGDPIYVVGAIASEGEGGPWRASQRKRIGPERGRYLIGSGGAADFKRHLAALESAHLIRFALLELACALALLLLLGLRPFA